MPQDEGDAANRATVALVYGAVREVKELTRAGFVDVQRQLDGLATLPTTVSSLHERVTVLEVRVTSAERAAMDADAAVRKAAHDRAEEVREAAEERAAEVAALATQARAYRRIHLPAIALGAMGFILAVVNRIYGVG